MTLNVTNCHNGVISRAPYSVPAQCWLDELCRWRDAAVPRLLAAFVQFQIPARGLFRTWSPGSLESLDLMARTLLIVNETCLFPERVSELLAGLLEGMRELLSPSASDSIPRQARLM